MQRADRISVFFECPGGNGFLLLAAIFTRTAQDRPASGFLIQYHGQSVLFTHRMVSEASKKKKKKPTGRSRTYLRGFFLLALRHPSAIVLKQRGTDGDYFDNRGYLRSATTCPTVPPGEALLDVILILSVEGQPVAMTTMT